ncbi:MAG: NusG domain II-containing protein [Clostridiales bacterium]|nr:NusG domain II-containing protein [Clostridiales bacterium]
MKSSAADRRRPTRWDGVVVLCVLLAAAALFWFLRPQTRGDTLTALVTLDGETIASLPLSPPDAPEDATRFAVDSPYPLVLEYRAGGIRVAQAQCPGGDCVHTGWISSAGAQIICLPNRLIVTIQGGGPPPFDAVTG